MDGAMPPVRPLASQCRGTARTTKGEAQLLNLGLTKKGNLTPTRRLRRPDVRHGYAVPEATRKMDGAMPPVRPLASQCRGTARITKGEAQLLNLRLTKKGDLTPTRRLRRPDVRHGYAGPGATRKMGGGKPPGRAFGSPL